MMGLHQNYPVNWAAERMEGLTLDLGLDGLFSPLPTELNPDSESTPWRFFGHSHQTQEVTDNLDGDPCALFQDDNGLGLERKPDVSESSMRYPPPLSPVRQQPEVVNKTIKREDMEPKRPTRMSSSRQTTNSTSQTDESYIYWRNIGRPRNELHLCGTVRGQSSQELPRTTADFRVMKSKPYTPLRIPAVRPHPETIILDDEDDFPEVKPDPRASLSIPAARQHPETIILLDSDTDDDDEFLFEDEDDDIEEVGKVANSCADSGLNQEVGGPLLVAQGQCAADHRLTQERVGALPASQAIPLRQIKQIVRCSTRIDDDYASSAPEIERNYGIFSVPELTKQQGNSSVPCVTRNNGNSSVPELRRQHGSSCVPAMTRQHGNSSVPVITRQPGNSCVPEVTRYHGTKGLESGERNHEMSEQGKANPKRVRGYGDHDWLPSDLLDASQSQRKNEAKRAKGDGDHDQQAYGVPTDVRAQSTESSCVQVQTQKPFSVDVNQAIGQMPPDTAEAFKELIRLVGACDARATRAVNEMENWRSTASDSPPHHDSPPAIVNQVSLSVNDMESKSHISSDFQHFDSPPSTVNQASLGASGPHVSSDFQCNDSLPLTLSRAFGTVDELRITRSVNNFQPDGSPSVTVTQASHTVDELERRRAVNNNVKTDASPPAISNQACQPVDKMGSMHSVNNNSHYDDSRSGVVTNVSNAVDEMESRRSVIRNSQKDNGPLATENQASFAWSPSCGPSESATRVQCSNGPIVHEQHANKKISNGDVVCSSPNLVVHKQAKEISNTNVLRCSPDPVVYEQHAVNRISNADVVPCSPSSVVYDPHVSRRTSTADYGSPNSVVCDQDVGTRFSNADVVHSSRSPAFKQDAGKGNLNSDVVLYKSKPEPMEFSNFQWREDVCGSSVVPIKQEQVQHYQNTHDRSTIRPVAERPGTLGPCLRTRKLILTALDTFEQVRMQIIKDPSYGQTTLEPQGPQASNEEGAKVSTKRLRADLKAACLMRKKGFWLNDKVRPIGEVPGVVVGDCFRYRIEMAVIGLHRAVQAGIAVVPSGYSPYGVTVASSVVIGVSDPYQDDNDMGDTVVYSGQGGLCGKTKESQDQKLQRGNLALSNSFNLKLPVRLIRGHKEQNTVTGILYSYDGLYEIIEMNYVDGVNGKKVYKFTMHRLPGQAPIFSGYPAPVGLQPPPALEPTQHAVHWTESIQTPAGQQTQNAVHWTESSQPPAGQPTQIAVLWAESSQPPAGKITQPTQNVVHWTESCDVKPLYLEKHSMG